MLLVTTGPVPKRVAAFPPNVIPADPVNNHKIKKSVKSTMQNQQAASLTERNNRPIHSLSY